MLKRINFASNQLQNKKIKDKENSFAKEYIIELKGYENNKEKD